VPPHLYARPISPLTSRPSAFDGLDIRPPPQTLEQQQEAALPGLLDDLESAVCEDLLRAAAAAAMENRLDRLAAIALEVLLLEEVNALVVGMVVRQLGKHMDAVADAGCDMVLSSLLRDMCEEVTAQVWDEETPRDSFTLLDAHDHTRNPRTKPSRLHTSPSASGNALPTQVFSRRVQATSLFQTGYRQETVTFSRETHSRSYMMPPSVTRDFSFT